MILAPRSCPSSPGFATTTRIFRSGMASESTAAASRWIAKPAARAGDGDHRQPAGHRARRGRAAAPDVSAPSARGSPSLERPRRRTGRRPTAAVAARCSSGVSPPLGDACTTIVPGMFGCGVQMYANVPASLKVCERLCPSGKMPVSKLPSGEVDECGVGPSFVQVTVSPCWIVICAGANWKSATVTEPLAAAVARGFCLRSRAGCSAGAGAAACSGAAAGCSGAGAAGSGAAAGSRRRRRLGRRGPGSPARAPARRQAPPRPPVRRPRMRAASLEARAPRSGRRARPAEPVPHRRRTLGLRPGAERVRA